MTEQDIREAFEPYMHPAWGVVGRYKAGTESKETFTCDNYHLLTALYFRILISWGFKPSQVELLKYAKFVNACTIQPGLMCRFPNRVSDVSQDECYGACSVFKSVAMDMNEFGSKHWYSYNLVNPGAFTFNTFLGRFPCFIGYIKTASKSFPMLWRFYWFVGFILSATTSLSESSGKQLSYLQIPIMKDTFIGRVGVSIWTRVMSLRYPTGFQAITTIWASDHPIAHFARSDWK